MKYYDNSNPNMGKKTGKQNSLPVLAGPAIEAARKKIASMTKAKYTPTAVELVSQAPEVVRWLRDQMTAKPKPSEGGKGKGGSKSRPPFRVAFMDAADREVAALEHWCKELGIDTDGLTHFYRVNGRVAGVMPGEANLEGIVALCVRMIASGRLGLDDSILTDSKYGLWSVRSNHYSIWPELAGMFLADRLDDEEVAAATEEVQVLF